MLRIGSKTRRGDVVAVLWIGERYYSLRQRDGCICLVPAVIVESELPYDSYKCVEITSS